MVNVLIKMGPKGQIVIPKFVRDSLGLLENKPVVLEVLDKKAFLKLSEGEGIVSRWESQAKHAKLDVSKKWVYGDKLYEEGF